MFTSLIRMYVSLTWLTEEGSTFEGCISRVRFNDIYPLKAYYTTPRPSDVTSSGNLQKSRCNVEEAVPKLAEPIDPGPPSRAPPTEGSEPLPPAAQTLSVGDKAAIACKSGLLSQMSVLV